MNIKSLVTWLACRVRKQPATTVVFHATAGRSASGAISWLRKIGLSYHYVIEYDGTVIKCVPYSKVAFHAGVSKGPNGSNVNNYSIGVAFVNIDDGKEAITAKQMAAAKALLAELFGSVAGLKYITRHLDISPGRKVDPRTLSQAMMQKIAPKGALIWPS